MNFPSLHMLATSLLLLIGTQVALPQSQGKANLPAADLVRAVIRNEMTADAGDLRWRYLLNKQVDGKEETREVVETRSGSLDRLLAVAGKPLSSEQQRQEVDRVFKLSHNSDEQRKLEASRRKDGEQCRRFLQMIPDAFIFEYGGESGTLVKVLFKPNPNFQPPSREAKVLHEMAGEIWVDVHQQRLASIDGQIINEVKFANGLLGHLEKGGKFAVRRSEITPGHWELTEMVVNMTGKALLFKTISVQQKELHTHFQQVPDDLSLADAAGLLLNQTVVAAKR